MSTFYFILLIFSVLYPSQYCNPPLSQSNQQQNTEMRPLRETVNYSSDTTIVARGFYTQYINENLLHNSPNPYAGADNYNSSRQSQSSSSSVSNSRPLPPVPN